MWTKFPLRTDEKAERAEGFVFRRVRIQRAKGQDQAGHRGREEIQAFDPVHSRGRLQGLLQARLQRQGAVLFDPARREEPRHRRGHGEPGLDRVGSGRPARRLQIRLARFGGFRHIRPSPSLRRPGAVVFGHGDHEPAHDGRGDDGHRCS
jgi:hypothetical protein